MNIKEMFTFDDLLLKPKYSEISSRSSINLETKINKLKFKHPVIPANMKSIMSYDMAIAIIESGGLAILHRFDSIDEQLELAKEILKNTGAHIAVSIGVQDEDYDNVVKFYNIGIKIFCIDIAHGHSKHCADMIRRIKNIDSDLIVIAGNVATGEGAKFLWEAGADVVKAGIGGGCFAAGTKVLMANGFYKDIESVNPGEFVINKDGKPVKVLNAFCTGKRKVVKLRNNIFYEDTYVTPDHKFWIGDLNTVSKKSISNSGYTKHLDVRSKTVPKKSKFKWKEVSDLKQDVLLFPRNITFNLSETFNICLNKRYGGNYITGTLYKVDSNIIPNYDCGYLFGTFLGDGTANCTEFNNSNSGVVNWYFGKNEVDIVNKLVKCIESIFGKKPEIYSTNNMITIKFYYKPLADFLFDWGKKKDKRLPENLLVNSIEYLQGIYDGLLDSDGHYGADGRNALTNTSKSIIELFNIVNYLLTGIMPNNLKRKTTAGNLKNCKIDNCNQAYDSSVLKNGKVRLTNNYQVVKLLEYSETESVVDVYDLEVDCETHSFIANNTIVHNSICSTRIETGNGVPQLSALNEIYDIKRQLELDYLYNKKPRKLKFIADGGIKNAGDICKALCFADMVMVGNLVAGCEEAPGETIIIDGKSYKDYNGSSTHKSNYIEGVESRVPIKGKFKDVLERLLEGLRSGCSYQGVEDLYSLKSNPEFCRITNAGLKESHPHDVIIKG